jgi:ribosomal-protein-alanine N-acetyltransferase
MKPGQSLPEGHAIKAMKATDLESVHALEAASQAHPWSLGQLAAELDNPAASVDLYWQGDSLAGFICSWLIAGELQIQNVATAPEYRRQGVALCLLEHVMSRSRRDSLESVWLEVRVSNVPAIRLYQQLGFQSVTVRRAYYSDGEDALVMSRHET